MCWEDLKKYPRWSVRQQTIPGGSQVILKPDLTRKRLTAATYNAAGAYVSIKTASYGNMSLMVIDQYHNSGILTVEEYGALLTGAIMIDTTGTAGSVDITEQYDQGVE